jgi:hypothetical protein
MVSSVKQLQNFSAFTLLITAYINVGTFVSNANTLEPLVPALNRLNQLPPLAQKTVEDNKYKLKVDLQGCKRNHQNVSCYLLLTNIGEKDTELFLNSDGYGNGWHPSRIIDSSGNEYIAKGVKIGNAVDNSQMAKLRLARNVPVRTSIDFQIPEQVVDAALIEVVYGTGAYDIGQSQFREATILTIKKNPKGKFIKR